MAASARCNPAIAAAQHCPTASVIASIASSRPRLPNGSCNFRKLDAGVQPPTICGCRAFWLDDSNSHLNNSTPERAWFACACGHHACFHDTSPNHDVTFTSTTHYVGSENHSHSLPRSSSEHALRTFPSAALSGGSNPGIPAGTYEQQHSQYAMSMRMADPVYQQPQQDAASLPSTAPPSDYCHDPIELPDYRKQSPNQAETRITIPYMMDYAHAPFSATEVNTPSVSGSSHAVSQVDMPEHKATFAQDSIGARSNSAPDQPNQMPSQKDQIKALQVDSHSYHDTTMTDDLRNIIQSYARRLDVLENSSFSHVPAEELHDKMEYLEGRLLELEAWKADADMQMQQGFDDAQDSISQSQGEAMENMRIGDAQRMADMDERLAVLESAYPSYAYPWEFEVVLLPWGSNLRGIWVSPSEDTRNLARLEQASPEWNGLASPVGSLDPGWENSLPTSWMPTWPVGDQRRLVAKAPGPNSAVFKRLRSRGLVRKVTITECGASHIWSTIFNSFRLFLDQDTTCEPRGAWASPEYQGLNQPLVPLRKIRHASNLQFLSPHEMITPTSWSFDFLRSGVLMKTKGTHRLYITTSESYIQSDSGRWSWSWLRICGLPQTHKLFDVVRDEQMDEAADDKSREEESFWEYHSSLDHFPSFEGASSIFPEESAYNQSVATRSVRPSSEHLSFGGLSSTRSMTSLPLIPLRARTNSTPAHASQERGVGFSSKRRGLSPEEDSAWCQKRYRFHRSPEVDHHMACLTPRLSHEPRSPSPPVDETEVSSSHYTGTCTAQHAYATPHSNSVAVFDTAGGDTEPDSDSSADYDSSSSSGSENEWEGVADDDTITACGTEENLLKHVRSRDEVDTPMYEEDIVSSSEDSLMSFGEETSDREEDDDSDDGLTIYDALL